MIELRKLIENVVHFGHKTSYWSPKMDPYIWGKRNNIHLIDVSKTAIQLEKAAEFLKDLASKNKQIMWVGTKKPARSIVEQTAKALGQSYVTHRWIGGTLTNYSQVKKSVTKLLHGKDILAKSDETNYTKKELSRLSKGVNRLEENIGGIVGFKSPLGALVVVDVRKERAAIKEAAVMGVPIIALVDTNSDPTLIDYVIPANDDAPKSIRTIVDYLAEAIKEGQKAAKAAKEVVVEEVVEVVAKKADKDKPAKKAPVAKKDVEKKAAPAKEEAKTEKKAVKAVPKKAAAPAKEEAEKPAEKKPAAKKAAEADKKSAPKK